MNNDLRAEWEVVDTGDAVYIVDQDGNEVLPQLTLEDAHVLSASNELLQVAKMVKSALATHQAYSKISETLINKAIDKAEAELNG